MHEKQKLEIKLYQYLEKNKGQINQFCAEFDKQDHFEYYYRVYHHSFKAYWVQGATKTYAEFLMSYHPTKGEKYDRGFNSDFRGIIEKGTNINFEQSHNKSWHEHLLPMFTAYDNCRVILQAMKKVLDSDESVEDVTSGILSYEWGLVLYLYNMR